jgi:hypothetical protein
MRARALAMKKTPSLGASFSEMQSSPLGMRSGNSSRVAKLPNSSSGRATLRTAKPLTE